MAKAENEYLREQLKRWGMASVARYVVATDGRGMGDTVLSRVKEFAPGKEKEKKAIVGRDGYERRERMAFDPKADPNVKQRIRVVPMWACDPVPAHNDADRPHDREPLGAIDTGIPDDLLWIESLVNALGRAYPLRAKVLREEFTGTGTQRMKARRVQEQYGGKLSVHHYKAELRKALEWMQMRRAA